MNQFRRDHYYRTSDGDTVARTNARLAELEAELAVAYQRWEELEAVAG